MLMSGSHLWKRNQKMHQLVRSESSHWNSSSCATGNPLAISLRLFISTSLHPAPSTTKELLCPWQLAGCPPPYHRWVSRAGYQLQSSGVQSEAWTWTVFTSLAWRRILPPKPVMDVSGGDLKIAGGTQCSVHTMSLADLWFILRPLAESVPH